MDTVDVFSITDIERLTGIKAHTIRIWEKRYGVPEPKRTSNNIRYFSNDDLRTLLTIRMLTDSGLRIHAIAKMSAADREIHLKTAMAANGVNAHLDETFLISLLQADEWKFNQCYQSVVSRLGLERAFSQFIFPFLERVGVLWQVGSIEPAQEHFFFNLVRQKLIAAIDDLGLAPSSNKGTALLFLPEHEFHEMGLLFYNYMLRARGFHTVYLGQSVPVDGLPHILRRAQPQWIITGMTNSINPNEFPAFYNSLTKVAGNVRTFFTGNIPEQVKADYEGMLTRSDLVGWLQEQPPVR